jgi:hypothetical protein
MIKNVLPFFLDGGIENISSHGGSSSHKQWSGKSSFVNVTGVANCTIVIGDKDENGMPIKHGTMLVVTKETSGGTVYVNPDSDFSSDNFFELTNLDDSVLLMYKGPSSSNVLGEWIPLSRYEADTTLEFTGGVVGSATTFSELVTMSLGFQLAIGATGTLNVTSTSPEVQQTNRSTSVTINEAAGIVQTNTTALAAQTSVTFTVNNSIVSAADVVLVSPGANCENITYAVEPGIQSFDITYTNQHATADLTTSQEFRFIVFKLT